MDARGTARWQVILALAIVYVVWGSTYLAMHFAVETLPPFGMAAARFLTAGSLLYGWARFRGAPRPTAAQWRASAVVGLLLLLCANGAVAWSELSIPSSLAALLVSTVPLFMALLEWMSEGRRPTLPVVVGLLIGFGGVVVLVDPRGIAAGEMPLLPVLATVGAALAWSIGSMYARKADGGPGLMGPALQMLAGGAGLLVTSTLTGELAGLDLAAVSSRSMGALVYLIVFGSLIGFTAYIWLLRHVQPSLAGTYAYVNPVVAVLLGWALANEPVGPRTIVASALIIGAVCLITVMKGRPPAGQRDDSWQVLPDASVASADDLPAAHRA